MAKTCGNCVYAKICKNAVGSWFSPKNIAYCEAYKDSTNYVEVVRCEDCIHCNVRYGENEAYCGHPDGLNDCLRPDDFCSYGERREGE